MTKKEINSKPRRARAVIELRNRGPRMTAEEAREIWARHRKPY